MRNRGLDNFFLLKTPKQITGKDVLNSSGPEIRIL
jgi:hypothetical protein